MTDIALEIGRPKRQHSAIPEVLKLSVREMRNLAHPIRVAVVAALAYGDRTAASLAREFDVDEVSVARHLRALEALGIVAVQTGEGARRVYVLHRLPIYDDDAWESLPAEVKRAAATAHVNQLFARASVAAHSGGFDRRDMHLMRWTMRMTEERWRRLSEILNSVHEPIDAARAESDQGPDDGFWATAVTMLFTDERVNAPDAAPPPPFEETAARERATELMEEIEELMISASTPWERVEVLASELRLVARASVNLDGAAAPVEEQSSAPE